MQYIYIYRYTLRSESTTTKTTAFAEALAHCGALVLREDEFFEAEVALSAQHVAFHARRAISAEPELMVHVPLQCAPGKAHKLQLVLELRLQGWEHIAGGVDSHMPGGERKYPLACFARSRLYFLCLCMIDDLFAKGIPLLLPLMPEAFLNIEESTAKQPTLIVR